MHWMYNLGNVFETQINAQTCITLIINKSCANLHEHWTIIDEQACANISRQPRIQNTPESPHVYTLQPSQVGLPRWKYFKHTMVHQPTLFNIDQLIKIVMSTPYYPRPPLKNINKIHLICDCYNCNLENIHLSSISKECDPGSWISLIIWDTCNILVFLFRVKVDPMQGFRKRKKTGMKYMLFSS